MTHRTLFIVNVGLIAFILLATMRLADLVGKLEARVTNIEFSGEARDANGTVSNLNRR